MDGVSLDWMKLIVQFGSFGLIVWLFIYWLPRWTQYSRDDRKADREQLTAVVDSFRREIALEREHCDGHFKELMADFDERQKAVLIALKLKIGEGKVGA